MRVLISSEGTHDPPGTYMVVDDHGFVLDLSAVGPPLVDPTISRVTWDLQLDGATMREGGTIFRPGSKPQVFWDQALLKPYLDAFEAKRAKLFAADAPMPQPPAHAGRLTG